MGGSCRQNNLPAFHQHVTGGLTGGPPALCSHQTAAAQLLTEGTAVASRQSAKGLLSFPNCTVVPLYLSENTFKWAVTILQADRLAGIRITGKGVLSIFNMLLLEN